MPKKLALEAGPGLDGAAVETYGNRGLFPQYSERIGRPQHNTQTVEPCERRAKNVLWVAT